MCAQKYEWHYRWCYVSNKIVSRITTLCNVKYDKSFCCQTCSFNKMHRYPFKRRKYYCDKPLVILYLDIWGSAPITSTIGFRYYLITVDEFSTYTWILPLKTKDETLNKFMIFQTKRENLLDYKIKIIQYDSKGEFLNYNFQNYTREKEIIQRFSCPYTPEQMGIVE